MFNLPFGLTFTDPNPHPPAHWALRRANVRTSIWETVEVRLGNGRPPSCWTVRVIRSTVRQPRQENRDTPQSRLTGLGRASFLEEVPKRENEFRSTVNHLNWIVPNSAVSKPNFARKYAFESSRPDIHNALLWTALQSQFLSKNYVSFCKINFATLAKKMWKFSHFFTKILAIF